MILTLLRSGHDRVFEYGYSLFKDAHTELISDEQRQIVNNAYAHRMSRADDDNWKKFVNASEKKQSTKPTKPTKKQMTKADHMAIIRRLKGI